MFYNRINKWAIKNKIQIFFEAFDEKWKGGEHPNEVEKHWGLFNSDRTPKYIIKNDIFYEYLLHIIILSTYSKAVQI